MRSPTSARVVPSTTTPGSVAAGCGSQSAPATTSSTGAAPSTSAKASTSASSEPSTAVALADLQAGHEVSAADPLVAQIARETSALARRCRQGVSRIDAIAGFVSSALRGRGVHESPLAALQHLNATVPSDAHSFDCQGAAFSYVALRARENQ